MGTISRAPLERDSDDCDELEGDSRVAQIVRELCRIDFVSTCHRKALATLSARRARLERELATLQLECEA